LVIARTEALIADLGLDEALKRAQAGLQRGRGRYDPRPFQTKTPGEIAAFARRWQGETRLVVVPTAYPDLTEARIRELGNIGMVIYGNHAVRAAVTAMRQVFAEIRADGGIHNVDKRIVSVEEIFELQRVAEMKSIEQKYLR
jgi:phosphoenolpyruvate phosphomutase